MKKIILILCIAFMLTSLAACGGGIKQSTMQQTAETFVQAMSDGNEEMLNEINKSGAWDFPTHYLISDFASKYADLKADDFDYEVDEEKNVVVLTKKGEDEVFTRLKIEKIGDKYYFMGFSKR